MIQRVNGPYVAPEVVEAVQTVFTPYYMSTEAKRLSLTPEEFSGYVKGISSFLETLTAWSYNSERENQLEV